MTKFLFYQIAAFLLSNINPTGLAAQEFFRMNCRIKTILSFILIFLTLQGISGNEPPEFLSQPVTTVSEFMLYYYTVIVSDPDPDDTLEVFMGANSNWLTLTDYGNDTAVLAGFPAYYFTEEAITLGVSDGKDTSWQNFDISLYCINSDPQIISEPVLTCFVDSTYSYQVMGLDFDGTIQFSAIEKPEWLLLSQTNDDSAILTGIPAISDTGIHKVSIKASRANGICKASSYQNFEIEVKGNSLNDIETKAEPSGLLIYPNPATKWLVIESENLKSAKLEIINEVGRLIFQETQIDGGKIHIDVSAYASGFYFYRLTDSESNRASHGRFIVN